MKLAGALDRSALNQAKIRLPSCISSAASQAEEKRFVRTANANRGKRVSHYRGVAFLGRIPHQTKVFFLPTCASGVQLAPKANSPQLESRGEFYRSLNQRSG